MKSGIANVTRKAMRWYVDNLERIAFCLLAIWCLLPLAMAVYDIAMNALGKLPSDEEMLALGMSVGYINYRSILGDYHSAVVWIGGLTLLHAVVSAALCRRRLCRGESLREQPWFYLLLALLLWGIISTLASDNIARAFRGGDYYHDGLSDYFVRAGVFMCASTLLSEKRRRGILRLYCAMVSAIATLMVIQEWTRNRFLDHAFPSFRAVVFNQFNHFGYILCMALAALVGLYLYDVSAGKGIRALYLVDFSLLLYALLMNDTFGAYVALVMALPFIYVFYRRSGRRVDRAALLPVLLFLLISLASALGVLPGASKLFNNLTGLGRDLSSIARNAEDAARAGTGRLILWRDTLERIAQRPILGFGPEGFYGENAISTNVPPHNEYLAIAGYLGIPALLIYLAALVTLARRQWKRLNGLTPMVIASAGATLGYLCSACFGNPVFNTAPYYWMFLGFTTLDGVSAPLLSPTWSEVEAQLDEGPHGKHAGLILAVGLSLIVGLLGAGAWRGYITERAYEQADIQCMRGAESLARLYLQSGSIQVGERYWFDAGNYVLLPEDGAMPAAYGLGTKRRGNAIRRMGDDYPSGYGYDEGADYRNKLICVSVSPSEGESSAIALSWVDYSE